MGYIAIMLTIVAMEAKHHEYRLTFVQVLQVAPV